MVVEDVLLTIGPEIVFPSVVIRKYTVPGSEAMRNLCVDIIEEIVGRKPQGTADEFHQARMQYSSGQGEGGIRADGAFHMGLFRQQPNGDAPMDALRIAVVHPDVHDAGGPSAVPGREGTLVQGYLFHGIGREDGKQAQQMLSVIHGYPVHENQVLVRSAAPYIESG